MSSLKRVVEILLDSMDESKMSDGATERLKGLASMSPVDTGMSSVDNQAFARRVSDEFGVTWTVEDCESMNTFQDLVDRLDR